MKSSNYMAAFTEKIIDKAGEFIANRLMLKPQLDKWQGEDADLKRHKLLERRKQRRSEMNFIQTSDGKMKVIKPKNK